MERDKIRDDSGNTPVPFIFIGGFLGAGKTTLLLECARRLRAQNVRVGLIANDQADGLADTALLRQAGGPVAEVAGGCFCCRFDELVATSNRLVEEIRPDLLLGEPVGSCADLAATVYAPLQRDWPDRFRLAPFSVLVDPQRLHAALREGGTPLFSEKVAYIYRKQLEEAQILVIAKSDLLETDALAGLKAQLAARYPEKPVMSLSAKTGEGVEAWLNFVRQEPAAVTPLADMDYATYAAGEAELGWLNAAIDLEAEATADWTAVAQRLLAALAESLANQGVSVAHLKLFLSGAGGSIAANLTAADETPALSGALPGRVREAHLVLNCRAHGAPEQLRESVGAGLDAMRAQGVKAAVVRIESFSPPPPRPTHRIAAQ